ncbi:LysR substrate-binding domain-containing protein [Amnibacterium sp. CER49]|uniref:LysR substrate-binding domain-containing protein n=1 Tax=Amnibacterium sp. CER49 TaxID=3039161 RepID=UPI00244C365D|nr:LysR substrate-binding domain-containing protein [Amnibacterium sp. CER49]MDH2444515.1 LysR substrate-binding domain-containing protein [Amnibacterium sp. CER49]
MTDGLVVGVVPGVTPDRWVRTWAERMPDAPLRIEALPDDEVGPALLASLDLAFARLPVAGIDAGELHVIPLWEETPIVVAAKDHPIKVFDTVMLADLDGEELYPGWDDGVLDLVAAGHGIARMPQSVLRATGRRDVVGRPISDAEPTRVGLVWRRTTEGPLIDEFIGIVRGRTANSSRGAAPVEPPAPKPAKQPQPKQAAQRQGRQRRGATSTRRRTNGR